MSMYLLYYSIGSLHSFVILGRPSSYRGVFILLTIRFINTQGLKDLGDELLCLSLVCRRHSRVTDREVVRILYFIPDRINTYPFSSSWIVRVLEREVQQVQQVQRVQRVTFL